MSNRGDSKYRPAIKELDLHERGLTEIIPSDYQDWDDITDLDCSNNNLTVLPNLPPNLRALVCKNNQLEEIPDLPQSLEYLDCSNNKLIVLPKLPTNLRSINCSNNQDVTTRPINYENVNPYIQDKVDQLITVNTDFSGYPSFYKSWYYSDLMGGRTSRRTSRRKSRSRRRRYRKKSHRYRYR